METEQKLTLEEKIMFLILGIILIIAVGVLIIDGLSKKEESKNNETPTSEVETGSKEESESSDNLKEVKEEETKENTSENKEVNKTQKKKLPSTAVNSKNSTSKVLNWNFNREIITECELGKKVRINKYVVLENGVMEEANVVVFKIVNNILIKVDITNNEFIAEEGTYIYTYTYNNITKSIKLNVSNNSLKETKKITNSLDINIVNNEYSDIFDYYINNVEYERNANKKVLVNSKENSITISNNKLLTKYLDVVP